MQNRIKMPRLGVNDDYVTLAEWLVGDGSAVKKGASIAVVETSKETSEIKADSDGILSHLVKVGMEVKVDDDVAVIDEKKIEIKKEQEPLSNYRITEKAKKIITEYGIDIQLLPKDQLIKEKDVLKFVTAPFEIVATKNNKVLIYGGGSLGKLVIDILNLTPGLYAYGVIDENYPVKKETLGVPVLGNDKDLQRLFDEGYRNIFNAVGFKNKEHWRKPAYEMLKKYGFLFPNIIHRSAVIEPTVQMEEGNLICAGAIIGTEAHIGNNCIINAGSVISHDCIISDHCHVASGAVLAGGVVVGENSLIGQNCTIYSDVKIGKNVVIQNGSHVFKDVPENTVIISEAGKR